MAVVTEVAAAEAAPAAAVAAGGAGAGTRGALRAPVAAWPGEVRQGSRFGPPGDQHEVGEEIGSGAAARVFSCRRLRTGEELAVKVVNLQRLRLLGDLEGHLARLDREVQILRQLHHERIVNLCGFHRTESCYFLVMERVRGGELFNQIVHQKCLSEAEARYVFRQLLEGIGYMHSKRVIHRDLKPENILIVSSRPAAAAAAGGASPGLLHEVKIADFGLSKVISEGASMAKTCVGTPQYWAPEVLNVQRGGGTYSEAADFWGLGAVLFVMLSGRYPFDGKKMPMDEQIRTATFSVTGARWKGISEDAKALIRGLLKVDPAARLRLEDCLRHPWVTGGGGVVGGPEARLRHGQEAEEEQPQEGRRDEGGAGTRSARPSLPVPAEAQAGAAAAAEGAAGPPGQQAAAEEAAALAAAAAAVAVAGASDGGGEVAGPDAGSGGGEATPPTPPSEGCGGGGGGGAAGSRSPGSQSPGEALRSAGKQDSDLSNAGLSRKSTSCYSVHPDDAARRCSKGRWWQPAGCWMKLVLAALALLVQFCFFWQFRGADDLQRGKSLILRPAESPPGLNAHSGSGSGGYGAKPDQQASHGAVWDSAHHQPPQRPYSSRLEEKVSEGDACAARASTKENIFRLSELLKLQVSIVGSLEMARLAFRHADSELAAATHQTFQQARELFQHASNLVLSYAQVAHQVSTSVLPDLQLAVEEKEPSLAVSLLGVVKAWVADMKRDGDEMRTRYTELQESVLRLARRAQLTKSDADRRLAEAVRRSDAKAAVGAEELARGRFALESRGQGQGLSPWQAVVSGPGTEGFAGSDPGAAGQSAAGGPLAAPLASMNSLTRQLFEQLGAHHAHSGGGEMLVIGGGGASGSGVEEAEDSEETWKRNVIDLLFMAPGAVPSATAHAPGRESSPGTEAGCDDGEEEEVEEESGDAEPDDTVCLAPGRCPAGAGEPRASTSSSVVRYVEGAAAAGDAQSAAETATNSSAALLRALRELRRVDSILQGCSAFWANMDGTVQKLAQMKDVTERLVGYASSSHRLRERFEQRLGEYGAFWASLERLCRQYGLDHQAAASKMQDFVREVSDVADLLDTAQSARQGAVAARTERRQHHAVSGHSGGYGAEA